MMLLGSFLIYISMPEIQPSGSSSSFDAVDPQSSHRKTLLKSCFSHADLSFLKGETIFYILYVLKAAGHCWAFSELSINRLARGIIIQMDIDCRFIYILPGVQGL